MTSATAEPTVENTTSVDANTDYSEMQMVTFEVASEEFAINILAVQEINRMMQITRVPQSPECVKGVINLRGKIIPVIDLRQRFDMETKEHDTNTRIIVVEVSNQVIGFIVDQVNEVLRVSSNIIEAAPSLVTSNIDSAYIEGVGKLDDRLLIMLDLAKLLSPDELNQLDQISNDQD
jgi:purine-binding chemotaxis protein CheW